MTSPETLDNKPLEKVYQEASQWVRFANTMVWSMGTILVPISFGFVGVALNNSGTKFSPVGETILGVGSVYLFSFWVYASSFYKRSSDAARDVLKEIEGNWKLDERKFSLYKRQDPILIRRFKPFGRYESLKWFKTLYSFEIKTGLFRLQMVTLVTLVVVWVLILCTDL